MDGMTEGFDSDDMAGLADVDFSDLKFNIHRIPPRAAKRGAAPNIL
ncbi:MAG: hypothetical protein ACLRPT_00905 [Akkermansia muciniphila]